jgi:Mg2+/Co2+ transporter CorB
VPQRSPSSVCHPRHRPARPRARQQDAGIQQLRDDSERTLATILITNNFVNVTIIMLCNYIFSSLVSFKEDG